MKSLIIYTALLFTLSFVGCGKFLDVTPKGRILPKTVADFELFLNDIILADAGYIYTDFMADDIYYSDDNVKASMELRNIKSYFWMKDILKITEDDAEWNKMYANIYTTNLVLSRIYTATDGTQADIERIAAEAKIHRAYYYFHLANMFGKEYNTATAATDISAPLLLVPDLEAKTVRASTKEVYDQILKDLNEAINTTSLPDVGRNYVHPGKAAANALLARVHLYMNNYESAAQFAEKALALKSTLLDYNTFSFVNAARPYSGVTNKPLPEANSENLFARTNSHNGIFTRFMISPELLSLMGEKDLRYVYSFTRLSRTGTPSTSPYPDYFASNVNYSIGVPEMMLIKAEALARNNQKDNAVALLNTLRQKRFKPADYVALSASNNDEALALVLRERRIELLYHGLRWFDLKRLNNDPRFKKDLSRSNLGKTYSLPAGSPNYLLPIAPKIISINPAIIQNPRN